MDRGGAGPPLHDLIGDALARATRAHEISRMALQAVRDSTTALAETMESSRRAREERAQRPPHPPE